VSVIGGFAVSVGLSGAAGVAEDVLDGAEGETEGEAAGPPHPAKRTRSSTTARDTDKRCFIIVFLLLILSIKLPPYD